MRTFIALDLDTAIRDRLGRLIEHLRYKGGGVGWVKAAGIHLTHKFLGEIDEVKAAEVRAVLERAAAAAAPFPLAVKGTGTFPPGSRSPRVLWAGVTVEPGLAALQERLESGLEAIGFPRETRPFHPHLTIGRVKAPKLLGGIPAELAKYADADFGAMTVRKVTLFRSVLRPTGAEYSVLFEAPFP